MAILQRHKSSIYGLSADLLALTNADSTEITRATGEEARIEGLVTAEVARATAEETRIAGLVSAEVTRATDEEARLEGRIDFLLNNADAAAIDSIAEVIAAFQAADSTVNGAITALSTALSADIATKLAKDQNLADLVDAAIARTNLGVYSKTEVDAKAQSGGAAPKLESLVVAGNTITLTNAPKGGINGVMNFATVRYIDANGVAFDAPLIATANPAEFTVSTDTANQWNGFTVQVQYLY